jgi:hypothetical protein
VFEGPQEVLLRSEPAGARVIIDKQAVGTTPLTIALALPCKMVLVAPDHWPTIVDVRTRRPSVVRLPPRY